METVRDLEVIEEQIIKAKKVLDESQAMVKKMQDIVFCMEVEAQELKEEIEFRQNILESEIHQ